VQVNEFPVVCVFMLYVPHNITDIHHVTPVFFRTYFVFNKVGLDVLRFVNAGVDVMGTCCEARIRIADL
jgi:hypothetical protein